MIERIALKQLTASDLTFFAAKFRALKVGNQKSVNLNADPFSKHLYPALASAAVGKDVEMPVALTILGPGTAGPYQVKRSITKKTAYKNWRLNGAAVPDPLNEPGRFDQLTPGDLALLEFRGEPLPSAMTLILVSASLDPVLHTMLAALVPSAHQTMVAISRSDLTSVNATMLVHGEHPFLSLLDDQELESALADAALGSESAMAVLRRRSGRKVTGEDLSAARILAEAIGADGEALAWIELSERRKVGLIADVIWVSKGDAAAAWDFEAVLSNGIVTRIDAKSTQGPFERLIHISISELIAAVEADTRYDLWRIFELDDEGGKYRVIEDIGAFAKNVLDGLNLPPGVRPDSFSINPEKLSGWGPVRDMKRPDDPE